MSVQEPCQFGYSCSIVVSLLIVHYYLWSAVIPFFAVFKVVSLAYLGYFMSPPMLVFFVPIILIWPKVTQLTELGRCLETTFKEEGTFAFWMRSTQVFWLLHIAYEFLANQFALWMQRCFLLHTQQQVFGCTFCNCTFKS